MCNPVIPAGESRSCIVICYSVLKKIRIIGLFPSESFDIK